jgi:hypothetical protein
MPWSHDEAIRTLRLSYNAAVSAHADCMRKLTEAAIRGEAPSAAQVQAEASARAYLDSAREKLHTAMAATLTPSNE